MLKMYNDLLETIDEGQVTIVVMIDLSAAFDTIDIPILIRILQDEFGIHGIPLKWINSYLTNRTMKVLVEQSTSETEQLLFGVPQGSCAGPVIFTLYISALNRVVRKYPADLYGYADDHKLAFKIQTGNSETESIVFQQLNSCLDDVIKWMSTFKLKMNESKTEIIVYGTRQQLAKLSTSSAVVGGCEVKFVNHVRDLGVIMTNTLNFDKHIQKKCQIAHAQLRNIKAIRKHLTKESTASLSHGLVHSHIDFCNGLLRK